ncbi:uroporphyrinogen-III C-methyltransferase [Parvibaculum sp.]|uniref:uroporphyrinogen-III C-methyltransferase n=1 Tax=Parvibaculum sp. TaxID=2024848 RepID=UPI002730A789|nr:uroporphyrinogen-III C-methyltransferase [Parvibaculum sp.]MDP1627584.1 uroporphyrinogen-III C-methyltransferase [Parvibaculum sp.]MDP2148763.1 uroporphyrinogen-III C-methyltransferase [Parvibaculum sp.]MDP3328713.1 uroporphyrinogen-III C-methyltransferase [Parvibaculum sp.]
MTGNPHATGAVSFIGAGPGDPELLTVRAMRRLQHADIVLHDALGTVQILDLLPESVRRINVGKRAGRHAMPQEEINRLLVNLASRGKRVARLKGGDPVIFGRLDEEMTALAEADIPYEIVPGITAASAAAASAGLSLTMRGVARRVQFVTGHTRKGEPFDPVAAGLADPAVTSVVYMARGAASAIGTGLIDAGWPGTTPVLIVASASQPDEVRVVASLNRLKHAVAALPPDAPLVLIVGNIVPGTCARICSCELAAH